MRIAGCLLMMGMIFAYPDITASAARTALHVFAHDIVPVLFPYMVLVRMLVSKLKGTGSSSIWIAIPLGWLGGSPSGASMIQSFSSHQVISRRTLLALCALTGTISPVFLINTAGAWFQDSTVSSLLVIAHFSGAALSAIWIFMQLHDDDMVIDQTCSSTSKVEESIIPACATAVLGIGGCLVFYSVLSAAVNMLIFKSGGISASLLYSLLEISGGLRELSEYTPGMRTITGILSAFACGFSGLSMLSQNAVFLKELKVTLAQLVAIGALRAFLSAVIMMFLMLLYSS